MFFVLCEREIAEEPYVVVVEEWKLYPYCMNDVKKEPILTANSTTLAHINAPQTSTTSARTTISPYTNHNDTYTHTT